MTSDVGRVYADRWARSELLGAGATKHVFAAADGRWVFKVPHSVSALRRLAEAAGRPLSPWAAARRSLRSRITFRRATQRILAVGRHLPSSVFQEVFPVTRVVDRLALRLVTEGTESAYAGRVIHQERVRFFNNRVPLRSFDWTELARKEQLLWSHGVGLTRPAEVWGPKNWGVRRDGSLCLADLGDVFVGRKDLVLLAVSPAAMDLRRRSLIRYPEVHDPEALDAYFEFMRRELSPSKVEEVWGRALRVRSSLQP